MQKIIVDERNDGKKLINLLTSKYPDLKLNTIYKSFRKKDIKINGKRINSDTTIHHGDIIELFLTDKMIYNHKDLTITAIYEDENIVVFYKPKNIEVLGDNSLTEIMKEKYEYLTNRIVSFPSSERGRILDKNGKVLVDNIGINTLIYNKLALVFKDPVALSSSLVILLILSFLIFFCSSITFSSSFLSSSSLDELSVLFSPKSLPLLLRELFLFKVIAIQNF